MIQDVMSVSYTELDNGYPALCFCSDLIYPLTNKTMVKTYINYMDEQLRFKILDLKIQDLAFTYLSENTIVKAKVNGKLEQMGFVQTEELYNCMHRVLTTLTEVMDES